MAFDFLGMACWFFGRCKCCSGDVKRRFSKTDVAKQQTKDYAGVLCSAALSLVSPSSSKARARPLTIKAALRNLRNSPTRLVCS